MIEFKRSKKNRSKNALFNPYKNGITSYDMAYLSSKTNSKNKSVYQNLLKRNSNCVLKIYFDLINKKFSKKIDIYSKKVKLLINDSIIMIEFKRSKKNRSKNTLFNPYKNGISSYDMAYLSSKRNLKNKTIYQENDSKKDYLAA